MFLYSIFTTIRTKICSFCENRENPNCPNAHVLSQNMMDVLDREKILRYKSFY